RRGPVSDGFARRLSLADRDRLSAPALRDHGGLSVAEQSTRSQGRGRRRHHRRRRRARECGGACPGPVRCRAAYASADTEQDLGACWAEQGLTPAAAVRAPDAHAWSVPLKRLDLDPIRLNRIKI